jgi:hypothetical protein
MNRKTAKHGRNYRDSVKGMQQNISTMKKREDVNIQGEDIEN